MKSLGVISFLEGALLFALIVPVMMKYTILPVETTPYWYFGIIFFLSLAYILLHAFPSAKRKKTETVKNIFFWLILGSVLFGSMISIVVDRGRLARGLNYYTHDIVLQLEAAVRFLSEGKNPYEETYFGTELESWNYTEPNHPDAVNPALFHFVMPPFYLISALPFYYVGIKTLGYFDGRMPLFFLSALCFIVVFRHFGKSSLGRLAVMLLALNPATVGYLLEGRSDFFPFSLLVFSFFCMEKKHVILSSLFFSLAILSKQTMWFIVPLYGIYVWRKHSFRDTVRFMCIAALVVFLGMLPFLLWDANAFLNSVVFYLTGDISTGYSVSGYGLGMVLYQMGVIRDTHMYYPFLWWQIPCGLLVLGFSGYFLWKKPSLWKLILSYGVVLCIVWYGSRYFNNSHIAYITTVILFSFLYKFHEEGYA